jgi:hypothetical protein
MNMGAIQYEALSAYLFQVSSLNKYTVNVYIGGLFFAAKGGVLYASFAKSNIDAPVAAAVPTGWRPFARIVAHIIM